MVESSPVGLVAGFAFEEGALPQRKASGQPSGSKPEPPKPVSWAQGQRSRPQFYTHR